MKKSFNVVPSVRQRLNNDSTKQSLTCHFLVDDLSLNVFPYHYEDKYIQVSVTKGEEVAVRHAILVAISGHADSSSFSSVIGDFVRLAARTAVSFGDASYEVVSKPTHFQDLKIRAEDKYLFSIDSIMPTTVHQIFGRPIQLIPRADVAKLKYRLIWLEKSAIFIVTLPRISRRRWRRIMDLLNTLDNESRVSQLLEQPGFEFSAQQDFYRAAQLVITRPVPWIQRASLKHKDMSETFSIYKWLLMKRFIFELRERIIASLNEMLCAAGRMKGFSASVLVTGLPTPIDVDRGISDLLEGGESRESIVRRFLL